MSPAAWRAAASAAAAIAIAIAIAIAGAPACRAALIEVGPGDDWRGAMQQLVAGDTLALRDGEYELSSYFALQLAGTAQAPVTIRAVAGARPHIRFVGTSQNIVNIEHSAHVVIDGIEFSGGSRGIRLTASSDITIRNCRVHDTAHNAISANDAGSEYARLQFLYNEIDHTGGTGEGFYLGCNDNACRIRDSLIANNYIHHLDGPGVSQGDGIEIKTGSHGNVVRDNVIHDTAYPGILVYHSSGGAPNIVERNLVWNSGDNGIQVTADAIVRNNIVLGAAASGIAVQPMQGGTPGFLVIAHNTVLKASGDALHLSGVTGPTTIANNALFASGGRAIHVNGDASQITSLGNAGSGSVEGISSGFTGGGDIATDFVDADFSGAPPQNLLPRGTLLPGKGSAAHVPRTDFDGVLRDPAADIGAYRARSGDAPLWPLQAAMKVVDVIYTDGFSALPEN